jgi:stage V sporulation protein G
VEITEVRIKLVDDASERLRAFCSITLDDCFVVRDLKIIEGSGGPFVAMPSRKLTFHCPECGSKNHLRAGYCNQCGRELRSELPARGEEGRVKLYADIAHPINSHCRELIQDRVLEAYEKEVEESQQPGYVSRYEDFGEELDYESRFETDLDFAEEERAPKGDWSRAEPAEAPRGVSAKSAGGPHKKPEKRPADARGRHPPPAEFGAGIF